MKSIETKQNRLVVKKTDTPPEIDAIWDKNPWNSIDPIELGNHMGDYPAHFPHVQAKMTYDDDAIYIIYKVKDQYVLAVTTDYQGSVYRDSCVEFFFTPHEDVSQGYFNLEMNCGGMALFNFQKEPRTGRVGIARENFEQIEIAHSMPEIVDSEIQDPVTWTLEYRIPLSILSDYSTVEKPAAGVKWRANFYKCADASSHPHWLTWSPVDYSRPNFHLPEFFGVLEFADATNVQKRPAERSSEYKFRTYPNPSNSSISIELQLAKSAGVELSILNVNGQNIASLLNENLDAGMHVFNWDAAGCATGVYICRVKVNEKMCDHRIVLVE